MTRGRRTVAVVVGIVLVVCGSAAALVAMAWLPRTANHFGYALPGPHGLPFRLSYAGRHYVNDRTCAGDTWCGEHGAPCTRTASLRAYHDWPLERAGTVATLFGPPHLLFRVPMPRGMTTMGLYVRLAPDCYLAYALEGGP